jgi:hypothetical protein
MEVGDVQPEDGLELSVDDSGLTADKFMLSDRLFLFLAGPKSKDGTYLIEMVVGGKYSLCDEDGHCKGWDSL